MKGFVGEAFREREGCPSEDESEMMECRDEEGAEKFETCFRKIVGPEIFEISYVEGAMMDGRT